MLRTAVGGKGVGVARLPGARCSGSATLQVVLAQRIIGSQIIDNLNAWMHRRALLTDLFVIDELLQDHLYHTAAAGPP